MPTPAGPEVLDVVDRADLPAALVRLGLGGERPVLVSVGGAAGLDGQHAQALGALLRDHVVPVLARAGALVVDGGTDSGVMKLMGDAVRGTPVPLVGVAASGTVDVPGRPRADGDAAALDAHHRAVLLVPGVEWGDESPWIAAVASVAAGSCPSATLVVNGGEITYRDARHSVEAARPLLVVAGTGRAADELAAAARGDAADERALELVASDLVQVVDVSSGSEAAALLAVLLGEG